MVLLAPRLTLLRRIRRGTPCESCSTLACVPLRTKKVWLHSVDPTVKGDEYIASNSRYDREGEEHTYRVQAYSWRVRIIVLYVANNIILVPVPVCIHDLRGY